jgi:hypothetical protein
MSLTNRESRASRELLNFGERQAFQIQDDRQET